VRAVVQRVKWARCRVDGKIVGECGMGMMVLVAAHRNDTLAEVKKVADRTYGLRIFDDAEGKLNLNIEAVTGESAAANMLVISQFTLYGDVWASRRPGFTESAKFDEGKALFDAYVAELKALGGRVETGVFGASMEIELLNDGPVTLVIEANLPSS
jgi:D-tyrosyl-tRNA(Tyr) deacylase